MNTVLVTITVAGFGLALVLLGLPRLLGYEAYVITGDSMAGAISRGSLIFSQPVSVESVRVGDILTFAPPGMDAPVTHRVVALRRGDKGGLIMNTRGDNVGQRDPWDLVPRTTTVPRFVVGVPWVGYGVALLSLPWVRVLFLVVPAATAAILVLLSLWRRAGDDLRRLESEVAAGPEVSAL